MSKFLTDDELDEMQERIDDTYLRIVIENNQIKSLTYRKSDKHGLCVARNVLQDVTRLSEAQRQEVLAFWKQQLKNNSCWEIRD